MSSICAKITSVSDNHNIHNSTTITHKQKNRIHTTNVTTPCSVQQRSINDFLEYGPRNKNKNIPRNPYLKAKSQEDSITYQHKLTAQNVNDFQ